MNKEKLKELSLEELEKKVKTSKFGTGLLAGLILVLYIVTISSTIKNGEFDTMMIVAIALTFTVIYGFRNIKALEEEINNRN